MGDKGADEGQDRQVEMWKVKKLIKSLQAARGYVFLCDDDDYSSCRLFHGTSQLTFCLFVIFVGELC